MAIPEACEVWIEQRIEEELDAKEDTGFSLREIGRRIANEIEKHFETRVKPETIYHRARKASGTNVPPTENDAETGTSTDYEKTLKKPAATDNRGGARKGAGRKPERRDDATQVYAREITTMDDDFKEAFDSMFHAIQNAKADGWQKTTRQAVIHSLESLVEMV
jgi:hypothetical protein